MKYKNKLTEEQIRPRKLKKINAIKQIDLNFLLKRKQICQGILSCLSK